MPRNAYRHCPVCQSYLARRAAVLEPELALRAFLRGVSIDVVTHEYSTAVHARHTTGGKALTVAGADQRAASPADHGAGF